MLWVNRAINRLKALWNYLNYVIFVLFIGDFFFEWDGRPDPDQRSGGMRCWDDGMIPGGVVAGGTASLVLGAAV